MTANNTQALNLMSPVDSDLFLSSDFATTFATLDKTPGTIVVPSYSGVNGLTSLVWGIPQHGRRVLQVDNGAEWYWYNPSGVGVWRRINTIGLLATSHQGTPISNALTTGTGTVFITTGNFIIPGGRSVRIDLTMGLSGGTGLDGIVIVNVKDNGSSIGEFNYRPGTSINANGFACTQTLFLLGSTIVKASSHNITVGIRPASSAASVGGLGAAVARVSDLNVYEV